MKKDEFEVVLGALLSNVGWKRVETGIAIRPINHPELESVIQMPANIGDKVWNWLHNPKVVKDREEYDQLRIPLIQIVLKMSEIEVKYGNPLHRKIFLEQIKRWSE